MVRWLIAIVGVAAACYAVLCLLMVFNQRRLVYYPQFTRVPASATDFALTRDDGVLRGWVVNPGRPRALVYFGGNGEAVQQNRALFERWLPDHTVYLVAYRGYGASDGAPSQLALLPDALAVFDRAQRLHPDAPVAVIGRSLGSGVASHVASRRRVEKLALVTPFDSLANVGQAHYPWLPVRWLLRERYDSVRWLADYRGTVLVVRAGRDEVVPAANTDRLIAELPVPPHVVALANASHNDLDGERYGQALAGFFEGAR